MTYYVLLVDAYISIGAIVVVSGGPDGTYIPHLALSTRRRCGSPRAHEYQWACDTM